MKIKPKEVMVNLPIVLMFDSDDELASFASNINTVINGKVKVKYENIGILSEKHVGIFYLNRHDEYMDLRNEFRIMIENEEMGLSTEAEQEIEQERTFLNGQESSLLAAIAQSPDSDHKEILDALTGKALLIAKVMLKQTKNAPKDIVEAANGFHTWARSLGKRTRSNGGVNCDTNEGPCSCGGWHHL